MARSLDRRAHIVAELEKTGLDYEIVTAVDGRELDLANTSLIAPVFLDKIPFPAGTAGCALSHLNIYKQIIADGYESALIIEDDVTLPADLEKLAEAVAAHLTGAEAALLSVDSPEPCQLSRAGSVPLPDGRVLALPIDITQPRSTGTYVITREACERMVEALLPLRVQADRWEHFYREGILDRVRCVAPLPVLKTPKLTSTIGSYALKGGGIKARVLGPLVQAKIPVLHQLLAYRRQRILEQWARVEVVEAPFVEMPSRLG